ncbi:unnamed protein product [Ectocarpus sp. CCAP 1310/34]|nr:unnamed protein product [Ectocarpus sp. CCAP 1310/34]
MASAAFACCLLSCFASRLAPPSHHDNACARRSLRPTALHYARHEWSAPTLSKPLPTSPRWSSSSSSSSSSGSKIVHACLANGSGDGSTRLGYGRRRRDSTRLMGLRKPRGPDGSRSSGENPDPEEEDNEGGSMRERMVSYAMPASKRRPPEEDDIWSKHSVFEFKSLNDPDTNACGYKGLSGQPTSSPRRTRSSQAPAPARRLTSSQQPGAFFDGVADLKEAERPTETDATFDADFFAFREKDLLASVKRRREMERRRRSAGGGAGGGKGSAVKVELATQLGLPASSTYDEDWTQQGFADVFTVAFHPEIPGFPGWSVGPDRSTPNKQGTIRSL